MKSAEHFIGLITGLCVGPVVTPLAAYIWLRMYWTGGGFVIDFGPAIILIGSVIWGAVSGAVLGSLALGQIQAVAAGFLLPFLICLLLFMFNNKSNDIFLFNTGALWFYTTTILSSVIIAAVNPLIVKKIGTKI